MIPFIKSLNTANSSILTENRSVTVSYFTRQGDRERNKGNLGNEDIVIVFSVAMILSQHTYCRTDQIVHFQYMCVWVCSSLGLSWLGLCAAWTLLFICFPMLGKFSAIISSKIFSVLFSVLLLGPLQGEFGVFNVPEVSQSVFFFFFFFILFSIFCSWY